MRRVAIGYDHAGREYALAISDMLQKKMNILTLLITPDEGEIDYPIQAKFTCLCVQKDLASSAILVCGSGTGMAMAANKIKGIRAANCLTPEMAELAREHNAANCLALGARLMDKKQALSIVERFVTTFRSDKERHARRVKRLMGLEDE